MHACVVCVLRPLNSDVLHAMMFQPYEMRCVWCAVCHAELNAILNKNSADVQGCRMYIALFPCNECAKLIIQAGIREVVYLSDKYHDKEQMVASRYLLELAGVKMR